MYKSRRKPLLIGHYIKSNMHHSFALWETGERVSILFGAIAAMLYGAATLYGLGVEWNPKAVEFWARGLGAWFLFLVLIVTPYRMWREEKLRADSFQSKQQAQSGYSLFPDMTIRELFFHLRPDILENIQHDIWNEVRLNVHDKFSTGQLKVWGRWAKGNRIRPLTEIPTYYWQNADIAFGFLCPDGEGDNLVHAINHGSDKNYADLHVNRAQTVACWAGNHSNSDISGNGLSLLRRDIG